jgi:hypothetical protein
MKKRRLHRFLCEVLAKQAVPLSSENREPRFWWGGGRWVLGAAVGLFVFWKGLSRPKHCLKTFYKRGGGKKRRHLCANHLEQPRTVDFIHSPNLYFAPMLCQALMWTLKIQQQRQVGSSQRGFAWRLNTKRAGGSPPPSLFPHSWVHAVPFLVWASGCSFPPFSSPTSLVYYTLHLSPM